MKEKRLLHILATLTLFVSCAVSSPAKAEGAADHGQEIFTIQTGSFLTETRARIHYRKLLHTLPAAFLPYLRIEFYDPYFAVRTGSFSDVLQARAYRQQLRNIISDAIVVQSSINVERLIETNDAHFSLADVPKRLPDATHEISLHDPVRPEPNTLQTSNSTTALIDPAPSNDDVPAAQEAFNPKPDTDTDLTGEVTKEVLFLPRDIAAEPDEQSLHLSDELHTETLPSKENETAAPQRHFSPPQTSNVLDPAETSESITDAAIKPPTRRFADAAEQKLTVPDRRIPHADRPATNDFGSSDALWTGAEKSILPANPPHYAAKNAESELPAQSSLTFTTVRNHFSNMPLHTHLNILTALLLLTLLLGLRKKYQQDALQSKSRHGRQPQKAALHPLLLQFKNEIIRHVREHHPADIHEVIAITEKITGCTLQQRDVCNFVKTLRTF